VSQLADRFIKNPADVVKVGDRLKVHVLEVDLQRRRIGLSARQKTAATPNAPGAKPAAASQPQAHAREQQDSTKFKNNPFADRFRR
jgi:uncharacterized protein